jgi:thiol-disulfide isomerase/thioredoxin
MYRKLIYSTLILVLLSATVEAQSAYHIKVKIRNSQDSMLILGHYFANMKLISDTAWAKPAGTFVFEGNEKLSPGMYIVVPQNKVFFEIIIGEDQIFDLETDTLEPVKNMKVSGSSDNTAFFRYLHFLNDLSPRQKELQTRLGDAANDTAVTNIVKKELKVLDQQVIDFQAEMKREFPDAFINDVVKASAEPILPEPWPLNERGNPDTIWAGYYYAAHYWDNFKLADARLLRTPIFHNKLDSWYTKVLLQHPDTLIKHGDWLIEMTRGDKEMFRYAVQYITLQSERSQIMGHDAIFVHMVNKYYRSNQAYWVSPEVNEKMIKKASMLENLLLGKNPPEMLLVDTLGNLRSIGQTKAEYTILYFWDPDCGHCRKETPDLLSYYHSMRDKGVEVIAICTSRERDKWISYIREYNLDWMNLYDGRSWTNFKDLYDIYSTPVLYILDKDKKVMAKRLSMEQLKSFMERQLNSEN